MIDLHCHILPHLDDGARNKEEMFAMLRIAAESGIEAVVATPHCENGGLEEVRTIYESVCRDILERQIPLKLYLGMEIFATDKTVDLLQQGQLLTLNNSSYPLVEFDFLSDGQVETQILAQLLQAGYRPLVAHPERYLFLQRHPELMNHWWKMGCLFQLNRGSLHGRFGMEAQQMSLAMIDRGFATVVASDAHSPRIRTPWMADVRDMLAEEVAPICARMLLYENPKSILKNEKLPPVQPEWFE